jgi:hypothetical protein
MNLHFEPLAFELYRRFRGGQSFDQLAAELAIPVDRIRLRIQAAAACWQRRAEADPTAESGASLRALCEQVGKPV